MPMLPTTRPKPISRSLAGGVLILLALAGCSSKSYPSLAPREGERLGATPAPAATGAPMLADPALAARLAGIADNARTAHEAFITARAPAETAIAAAARAAAASDLAGRADTALALLDGAHGRLAVALADIEPAYVDDRLAHAGEDEAARRQRPAAQAIDSLRAGILGELAEEEQTLDRLRRLLPR